MHRAWEGLAAWKWSQRAKRAHARTLRSARRRREVCRGRAHPVQRLAAVRHRGPESLRWPIVIAFGGTIRCTAIYEKRSRAEQLGDGRTLNEILECVTVDRAETTTDNPPQRYAKLTLPSVERAVPRRRLFDLLDDARAKHRAIWLQGPPGAGKTTLAASYGHATAGPTLWYRLDEADADPAVFFGYFREGAQRCFKRRTAALGFGPEYLGGLPAFARTFFRAALPARTGRDSALLVFDECHLVPDESPVAQALAILCEEAPADILCLFLSRNRPPPSFAGLTARDTIFAPGAEVLHFDAAETALLAQRDGMKHDAETLDAAWAITGGWAAALAMLLRHGEATPAAERGIDSLAAEAWRMLPDSARAHLLATCVLQTITPESATSLADSPEAPQTFEALAADCYLVSQTESPAPAWRVHPLWRTYLLSHARERLGSAGFTDLQRRAAGLARGEGRLDEAAGLYIEAGDSEGLRELIALAASKHLREGRHLQLLQWLAALPADEGHDPWLSYWEGLARMPVDPKEALVCLSRAHAAFGDDRVGQLLCAAGALSAVMFAWDDFREGPRWLAELQRLESFRNTLADPEIDALVIASGNAALMFDLGNPLLTRWAKAAERVLLRAPSALQTPIASFLVNYYVWHGELAACRVLLRNLREEFPSAGPLFAVTRHIWSTVIGFLSADHDAAVASVEAARELADQHGLTFYLPQIYGQEAYTALSLGDVPRAAHVIEAMAAALLPGRDLDRAFLHHVRSGLLLAEDNLAEARQEAERAVTLSLECANPTNAHLAMICLAQVLVRQGDWEAAETWLDRAEAFCVACNAPLVLFVAQITRADGLLSRGDADGAAAVLDQALPVARSNGWYNAHPFWQPVPMARLCVLALERDIETDYVRRVIRRRDLSAPPGTGEAWPWSVRIRALGSLEVDVQDTRLEFPVRAQGKPLELLRQLIAQGGEQVPLSLLADALWPDADGDRALAALKTTIHRLRGLLGHTALVQREGRLGLNPREVWLDVWAFERLLRGQPEPATLTRALGLYRGPLLVDDLDDEAVIPARRRLQVVYASGIERLCDSLLEEGRDGPALHWSRLAVTVDPINEALLRRYFELCIVQGHSGDAVHAYREYERRLMADLGVAPSPAMQALIAPCLNGRI